MQGPTFSARRDWLPSALEQREPRGSSAGDTATSYALFSGALGDLGVADVLQILQLMGKSALITVTRDGADSRLWCADGAIIEAESGQLRGEAALFRVLGFQRGWLLAELRPVTRTRAIFTTTQHLLLEAARRTDESSPERIDPIEEGADAESTPDDAGTEEPSELQTSLQPTVASLAAALAAPAARMRRTGMLLPLALLALVPSSYFWGAHTARVSGPPPGAASAVSAAAAPVASAAPPPAPATPAAVAAPTALGAVAAVRAVATPAAAAIPAAAVTAAPLAALSAHGATSASASDASSAAAPNRAALPTAARSRPNGNKTNGVMEPRAPVIEGDAEPVVRVLD
jgi:hypothetical protein